MTKDEAVEHFGTQEALAKALGITQGSVSLWGDSVPWPRQLQIERITEGKLTADPECWKPRPAEVRCAR